MRTRRESNDVRSKRAIAWEGGGRKHEIDFMRS